MGVRIFGCFSFLKKGDGFRFLLYLVFFSYLPGKPIYFQPNRTPMLSLRKGDWYFTPLDTAIERGARPRFFLEPEVGLEVNKS